MAVELMINTQQQWYAQGDGYGIQREQDMCERLRYGIQLELNSCEQKF